MKRLLLAFLLLVTTATVTNAQVSQATFVAKYTSWNNHVLNNQMNLAMQDFEDLKPMFISNFAQAKAGIAAATTQVQKDALLATNHDKQVIYTAIMNFATNMTANRAAMKAKFDDFAALY